MVRLKFSQMSKKIMPLTFANCFPIILIPLNVYLKACFTGIYNSLSSDTIVDIATVNLFWGDCSERSPRCRFRKMRKSGFVGFVRCGITDLFCIFTFKLSLRDLLIVSFFICSLSAKYQNTTRPYSLHQYHGSRAEKTSQLDL